MFIHVCASAQVEARDISGIDPQVLPFLLETGSIPGLEPTKLANLPIQEAQGPACLCLSGAGGAGTWHQARPLFFFFNAF